MRPRAHRVIPSLLVMAATAVPFATAAEILNHAEVGANASIGGNVASSTEGTAGNVPATGSASTSAAQTAAPTTGTQSGTTTSAGDTPQTYVGAAEWNRYGTVQATIIVAGSKITGVTISAPGDNPRSAYINGVAVPILQSETLQAQSANVDMVSGATYTSESYLQSLQSALVEAHLA
jgi:uncharacterized protein with FMN-binding domain